MTVIDMLRSAIDHDHMACLIPGIQFTPYDRHGTTIVDLPDGSAYLLTETTQGRLVQRYKPLSDDDGVATLTVTSDDGTPVDPEEIKQVLERFNARMAELGETAFAWVDEDEVR